MATIAAILSALSKIIALVNLILGMARDREQRGLGRSEAIAEALQIAHEELAWADAAEQEAERRHATIPDDSAFDTAFRRED